MDFDFIKIQIFGIGVLLLSAYLCGLIANRLKIGEVVGHITGGIIVGPKFLEALYFAFLKPENISQVPFVTSISSLYDTYFNLYHRTFENLHFFVFLFLGIIAFSIGEELHIDRMKEVGIKAPIICIIQALLTWVCLTLGFWLFFDFELIHALIVGSIGIATAPALTFIIMNKLNIKGKLRGLLANVVVLDDVIEVIFFSIFLGIAITMQKGKVLSWSSVFYHTSSEIFLALAIGFILFLILKFAIKKRKNSAPDKISSKRESFLSTILSEHPTPSVEILIIIIGTIAISLSIAIGFGLPFLITVVFAGFLISNFHDHEIFDSLRIKSIMPIFNILFFAIIGANININTFSKQTFGYVIVYLVLRSFGKIFGSWLGCIITGEDKSIRAHLPILMLPQAGMAAVETMLVVSVLKGEAGLKIFNTIIPALVVFELGGAWLSERTLKRWKIKKGH